MADHDNDNHEVNKPYIGRHNPSQDDQDHNDNPGDGNGAGATEYESRNVGRGNNNDNDKFRNEDDDDDDDNRKLRAAPDFDGPVKDRHCTDVLCFLLLIASWVVMTGIGGYAMAHGNIDLIIRPLDYDGNVCGTDYGPGDMTDYPVLLYVNELTGGVCVKECPNLDGVVADNLTDIRTLITYGGIWQVEGGGAELPVDFIEVGNYSNSSDALFCSNDDCYPNNSTLKSWSASGVRQGKGFAFYAASTYELLYRCLLTTEAENRLEVLTGQNWTNGGSGSRSYDATNSLVGDVYTFWVKLYGDIYIARNTILLFGFGLSLLISLVYIFLMRLPVLLTAVIWTSILLTIAMFLVGGYYAWTQANDWDEAEPQTVTGRTIRLTQGFALALFAIGAFLVVLACCLRRAIMEAITCTKQAGKAVNSMIIILLVPVLQTIGLLAFMLPFLYYSAYLASLGTITTVEVPLGVEVEGLTDEVPEIAYRVFEFDTFTERCGWYLLFCFFWTANFIVAMGDLIIAVSVAKWYFTKNKMTIGSWTVLGSIIDVCWYHSGTAAFGSLLVAIVQLIRAMIAKAQKEAEKSGSKLAKCVLCCCQCCFWCLETVLKFINKNAYIQTAIFSTSFCTSCRKSFALIFRNAARIAAITYVSSAVLIVGKLFISSVVTVLAYYYIVENLDDELYSVGGPISIIFLISYFISDMFMDVLDMGIATVLHCFIADEEMFDGDNRYHDDDLKDYVDKHGKES